MAETISTPSSAAAGRQPVSAERSAAPGEAAGSVPPVSAPNELAALRRRIDAIDDRLQDLLIERAEVVSAVGTVKRAGKLAPIRPGREAQILRRLAARHRGPLPRPVLLRMWRELLSGTVAMQGELSVAVQVGEPMSGLYDLARDHYGSHTPILAYRVSGEVVSAVAEGRVVVGVLPLPEEGTRDFWWRNLAVSDRVKPRVIARLPFAGAGNARVNGGNALVISLIEPEPSGDDCGLLALETNADVSRGRLVSALAGAGLGVTPLVVVPDEGTDIYLLEVENLLSVEDPRLAVALAALGDTSPRVALLGFYARPLAGAALAGVAEG